MISEDAMSDIINYVLNEYSLGFPTDAEFKCHSCPSGPIEHPRPTEENNMKVNQDNYFNQYQKDNFVV